MFEMNILFVLTKMLGDMYFILLQDVLFHLDLGFDRCQELFGRLEGRDEVCGNLNTGSL